MQAPPLALHAGALSPTPRFVARGGCCSVEPEPLRDVARLLDREQNVARRLQPLGGLLDVRLIHRPVWITWCGLGSALLPGRSRRARSPAVTTWTGDGRRERAPGSHAPRGRASWPLERCRLELRAHDSEPRHLERDRPRRGGRKPRRRQRVRCGARRVERVEPDEARVLDAGPPAARPAAVDTRARAGAAHVTAVQINQPAPMRSPQSGSEIARPIAIPSAPPQSEQGGRSAAGAATGSRLSQRTA